jgi:hypothetical protein
VYGSIAQKQGLPGATEVVGTDPLDWRVNSTIGDSGELSNRSSRVDTMQSRLTCSNEGYIKANGFASRRFRVRKAATDFSFRASTTN